MLYAIFDEYQHVDPITIDADVGTVRALYRRRVDELTAKHGHDCGICLGRFPAHSVSVAKSGVEYMEGWRTNET